MKKKTVLLTISMWICFGLFAGAHASTLSFHTGIDVLLNSGGGPDTGQPWLFAGQNTTVRLKYDSLLKFNDLFGADPGQIPAGSTVTSATLHLYMFYDAAGYERRLYQMVESWNESTRWNTLPGGGGIVPGVNTETSPVATWAGGTTGWKDIDVTDSLLGWMAGEDQYGWGIWGEKAGSFSVAYVNSFNNSSNRPWLEVDYQEYQPPSVPEPGTMLLLLIGVGGLAVTRMRTH